MPGWHSLITCIYLEGKFEEEIQNIHGGFLLSGNLIKFITGLFFAPITQKDLLQPKFRWTPLFFVNTKQLSPQSSVFRTKMVFGFLLCLK